MAGTVEFRLLAYRVEVGFEDESLGPALRALAVTSRQPGEALSTLHYDVAGGGPYEVREEGDRLATGVGRGDVVSVVAARCRARLMDHLSLGSWMAVGGGVARVAGRRVLLLDDGGARMSAVLSALLDDGHQVEGDEVVFFRDGEAVCLPRPWASELELGPIDVAVVLGHGGGEARATPVSTGEIVQALVARALVSWTPVRHALRASTALVGRSDAYQLDMGDVQETTDTLVALCS